ncbi:MAG: hypothetical protein ACM3NF_08210, partial [Gemmatimonadota bacterium]
MGSYCRSGAAAARTFVGVRQEPAAVFLDDAVLLEELRRGTPEAVEALFDRFHGKIYGLAMSILKNE